MNINFYKNLYFLHITLILIIDYNFSTNFIFLFRQFLLRQNNIFKFLQNKHHVKKKMLFKRKSTTNNKVRILLILLSYNQVLLNAIKSIFQV